MAYADPSIVQDPRSATYERMIIHVLLTWIRLDRLRNTEVKCDLVTYPKVGVDRGLHAYEFSQGEPSEFI